MKEAGPVRSPGDENRAYRLGSERFLYVYLDLTNQCNLRCTMCGSNNVAGPPTQSLGADTFQRLAAALFPNASTVVLSSAHEPLMVKRFFDFVAVAARHGVPRLKITTNGQLMNARMCERIMKSALSDVHVSVDGASAATYETIRRGATMKTLLDNLSCFTAARGRLAHPRLQIQMVMMPENYDDIAAFVETFAEFQPYRLLFIHKDYQLPHETWRERVAQQLSSALRLCAERGVVFEEIPSFFIPAERILAAFDRGGEVDLAPQAACEDPFRLVRIKPNGDVAICLGAFEPAGNVFQQDIVDIWNGEGFERVRRAWKSGDLPPECDRCPLPRTGTAQLARLRERLDAILTS